jgi:hypothetical protein
MTYREFLEGKRDYGAERGFEPIEVPGFLFPFQRSLVEWAVRKGRAAIFSACGTGKTPMQLAWADNVVRHTNKPVLILTPLAVSSQTVREAVKFGFDAAQSRDGQYAKPIVVTNYEKLRHFSPSDFGGVVCDESGCLKDFKSKTRAEITEFMRTIPYRLLCTATPAPNDYPELGTSAECIGEMGYQDMLTMFFRKEKKTDKSGDGHHAWARQNKWILKGHAEEAFWRWICSWARALRRPSDLGFPDEGYILPGLEIREHVVEARTRRPGFLFDIPAKTLADQREERRRTIRERCELVAELISHTRPAVVWCHLNPEGDLLAEMIPDSIQVSGKDSDELKEMAFEGFVRGDVRVMITKPVIGAWGLNWQHCAHQTFFIAHSYEQYHQGVHRSHRFGQKEVVKVDIVASEGEAGVIANLQRKSEQADAMFERLVMLMHDQLSIDRSDPFTKEEILPSWLDSSSPTNT